MRDEYDAIWPVSGRDFAIVQGVDFFDDGGLVVTSFSIEDPRIPEKAG